MDTERYCDRLEALDHIAAIRAIHQAFLQLRATADAAAEESFDNQPAIAALADVLKAVGHPGFQN